MSTQKLFPANTTKSYMFGFLRYNKINKKLINICAIDNLGKIISSTKKINITIKPILWKYFNMANIKMHIILVIV